MATQKCRRRKRYPTDLNDRRWALIEPLLPDARPGGRLRTTVMRQVVNAILSVTRAGGAWRLLPHDFPPWQTVDGDFRHFPRRGLGPRLHDTQRAPVRRQAGRHTPPRRGVWTARA